MDAIWQRAGLGRHSAVLGQAVGDPPAALDLRVVRVSCAIFATASVTAGSMRYLKPSAPPGGSHSRFNEKQMISSSPNQNSGMDRPTSANIIRELSTTVPRLRAATIPSDMENTTARKVPLKASSSV